MSSQFYVLHVLTGEESRFLQRARQRLERHEQEASHFNLWWPRRVLRERARGRTRTVTASLFPGYLVLEHDSISDRTVTAMREVTGFVRFLRSNDDIVPLGGNDLALIRHFLSFGEIVRPSKVAFDENNRIVVHSGPLQGLEGRIVKVDRRKRRAKVKLDLYDNPFLIDLAFDLIGHADSRPVSQVDG